MQHSVPSDATGPDARGPGFTSAVVANGYRWWYIDALSDDGRYGFTIIAFIGSVFSPYYAAARRRGRVDPADHCAINAVLYGPRGKRWAMTERDRSALLREPDTLGVGPSAVHWLGDGLRVDIDEVAVPWPRPLRGSLEVRFGATYAEEYVLEGAGEHRWWPIAPSARVSVRLGQPELSWDGHAYVDCNRGNEALEDGFRDWDWSRAQLRDGSTILLYHARLRRAQATGSTALALRYPGDGAAPEPIALPPARRLATTPVWRIRRITEADETGPASVLRTFEDTPFYSRSVIRTTLLGQEAVALHESLLLDRFRQRWVQALLPFRMPRRRGPRQPQLPEFESSLGSD